MKIGSNEPCPCGSGKKYKWCCINKEQDTITANYDDLRDTVADLQDIKDEDLDEEDEADKDDKTGEQELWLRLMNNFRKSMLKNKPHIKDYHKARKLHNEICGSMVDYYEAGNFKQKVDKGYASKYNKEHNIPEKRIKELVFFESGYDLNTDEGFKAFYDMLVYKPAPNMNCITEDYINGKRYRKPEKVEFLQSMLEAKSGLFEATGVDDNEGYIFLKEVFTGAEYKLTDIGLSGNKNYDEQYYYMRIMTYRGISFSASLNMLFEKTDSFIQGFISRNKSDYKPLGEMTRFIELYNRFSKDKNRVKTYVNTF